MEMKRLKQELNQLFTAILERAELGELPALQDTAAFERLARRFLTIADDAWLDECEDFVHIADELHKCVKQGNTADAILLVESLDDARTFCHRTYGSEAL